MKIVLVFASVMFILTFESANAATRHACSSDAINRAKQLLVFYRQPDELGFAGQWTVDDVATKIGTVAAIHGKRRYDVLQVWGYIYKARYRMRFIYALVTGKCVLMGEEIYEDSAL